MAEPSPSPDRRPILTVVVDELIQFDDQAVANPHLVVSPQGDTTPNRVLTDLVDELIEFTGTAVAAPVPVTGAEQAGPLPQPDPTA